MQNIHCQLEMHQNYETALKKTSFSPDTMHISKFQTTQSIIAASLKKKNGTPVTNHEEKTSKSIVLLGTCGYNRDEPPLFFISKRKLLNYLYFSGVGRLFLGYNR